MALRGNLRDFSLPDVFQLVTFSKKTGVLRIVRADEASGSVWFQEGDVFFASSNWRTRPLGERLVNSQRITPQALARALEIRALEPENGRRLGQILVDEAYITQKVLESFVQEQIQDTIFDLMRWDEGEFDFEPMPAAVEEDIGLSVSIENIVMEGSRRLEEWARIKKKIPSMGVVFKMATAPGEGSFEISLKPMEWELLVLVDGSRSVAELASATHRTDFEVARVIYGLFSAGLLEFASDEEVARNREERLSREAAYAATQQASRRADDVDQIVGSETTVAKVPGVPEPPSAVPPPVPAEALPVYSGPVEVPQFLDAAGVSAPTQEDQTVLEEFMGSLLGVGEPQIVRHSEPEPQPAEPYVPAEEPAFIGAPTTEPAPEEVVPTVEELLGFPVVVPEVALPAEETESGIEEQVLEVEPDIEVVQAVEVEQVPEVEQVVDITMAEPPVAEPEIPPVGVQAPPQPLYPLIPVAPLPDAAVPVVPVIEAGEPAQPTIPMSLLEDAAVADATGGEGSDTEPKAEFARDLMALGLGELPIAEPSSAPTHATEEPPASSAIVADAASIDDIAATESSHGDFDVTDIIESLGAVEPVQPEVSEADETDIPDGFDRELIEDAVDTPASGVISTDAYLSGEGLGTGLSSSLNDELSALTGAERRSAHPRPQASVKPLGAVGGIRRDPRVDRETLLKIIDGLERL